MAPVRAKHAKIRKASSKRHRRCDLMRMTVRTAAAMIAVPYRNPVATCYWSTLTPRCTLNMDRTWKASKGIGSLLGAMFVTASLSISPIQDTDDIYLRQEENIWE